jgi:hypothetical protein
MVSILSTSAFNVSIVRGTTRNSHSETACWKGGGKGREASRGVLTFQLG